MSGGNAIDHAALPKHWKCEPCERVNPVGRKCGVCGRPQPQPDHAALIARLELQSIVPNQEMTLAEVRATKQCLREASTTIEEYDSMRQALIAMCDRPSRYTLFGNDRENAGKRAVLIDDIRAIIEGGGKVET
jgi:hypothetical protein